jgi:glycosyltransferase involved in cell wall biosynthesis
MTTVLYVNHTSKVSGAERTLLDLLHALPSDVRPIVSSPSGRLADEVRALGVEHLPLRECDLSLKLGVRTPSAMLRLLRAGAEAGRLARRAGARFVHTFSVRAGLGCGLGSGIPMVAHAHDALGNGPASRAVAEVLSRRARVILAASSYVAERLPQGRGRAPVSVVDNPVDLDRFNPDSISGTSTREDLGIPYDAAVLAVVGQITPWKGQDTALRTLAGLLDRGIDAHLLVVGAPIFTDAMTRHDNLGYEASLELLRDSLSLGDRVHFLGERGDVPALLAASDLTLVPSWEEPFGRIVIESMAMGVPVLATSNGGPAQILRDGGGLTVEPTEPSPWVDAAHALLLDPKRRVAMGDLGALSARSRFPLDRWVDRVMEAYADVAAT